MKLRYFRSEDDLREMTGVDLGYSRWHEITQGMIDEFARVTGDMQWIHVDVGRAAQGPFGRPIAHGLLLVSLIPALVSEVYGLLGDPVRINYGFNRVRFPSPVLVASQVRASVRLEAVTNRHGNVLLETNVSIEVKGAEIPGCVAQWLRLIEW